jgi:hypothetical protein
MTSVLHRAGFVVRRTGQAAAAFVALAAVSATAWAQAALYTPIPSGFDFPAKEETLLTALKANDEATLRKHGWMVFAGLTQPARPNEVGSEAVWETWFSGAEVFAGGPAPQGVRTLQRRFEVPRQFRTAGPTPQATGQSQLSFTLFNKELQQHTRANKLHLAATLDAINAKWTAQTPIKDRKIQDYPREAMSLKIVWTHVPKGGFTALPVWDEKPLVAVAPAQPPESWSRVVAIDPSRATIPAGEKRDITLAGKQFKGAAVVPLSAFYHFALGAAQVALVPGAVEGDYMAVTAFHYTTKEIPNWVWATFWWHDSPGTGRFASNRPDASVLKAPWRSYLMDVGYDMDKPSEVDGSAKIVFNPYLEARFPNGVNSNCMSCHQRAVWQKQDFLPVTRGAAKPDDPHFKDSTAVDFLWSLIFEGGN